MKPTKENIKQQKNKKPSNIVPKVIQNPKNSTPKPDKSTTEEIAVTYPNTPTMSIPKVANTPTIGNSNMLEGMSPSEFRRDGMYVIANELKMLRSIIEASHDKTSITTLHNVVQLLLDLLADKFDDNTATAITALRNLL